MPDRPTNVPHIPDEVLAKAERVIAEQIVRGRTQPRLGDPADMDAQIVEHVDVEVVSRWVRAVAPMLVVEGRRQATVRPMVMVDPAVAFGRPAIHGITCDAVGEHVWAGENVATVADDYDLTRAEVLVACWHQGLYGEPRWRRRWRAWAVEAHAVMHACGDDCDQYDRIPDPPTKEDTDG